MAALNDLNLAGPVSLAVGWRHRGGIEGGRLEISNGVADHFREVALSYVVALMDRRARPFSPEVDLESREEYLVADLEELDPDEPLTNLLDGVELRDPIAIEDLPTRSLLFYGFAFPGEATFLRKSNPHQTAQAGRIFTRLQDTLSQIAEPVFAFDRQVDLLIMGDEILISSSTAFEQLFKEDDYLVRHIPGWVTAISDHLPLAAGSDQVLIERCRTNTRLRRRLETIHSRGHLKDVKITSIRSEAKKHGLDPNGLIRNGKLDFHEASVDDLLKLLNEDLLIGGFSGDRFAVDKKIKR